MGKEFQDNMGDLTVAFQYLEGPTRKMRRDCLQGHVVTQQHHTETLVQFPYMDTETEEIKTTDDALLLLGELVGLTEQQSETAATRVCGQSPYTGNVEQRNEAARSLRPLQGGHGNKQAMCFMWSPLLASYTFLQAGDVSPASSSSGTLIQYTPDSATSPTAERPSPHPSSQKAKEEGEGVVKKAKSRTAFSQEQLQVLHQRFQNQKYLSPQQIREMAAALGLTYKQVKTWFQNQRMKFKRCQKESQWVEKGVYLPQNGFHQAAYLDITPTFHQGFPVSASRNLQAVTNMHQAYSGGQAYGNGQSLYSFVAVEDEGLFGKGGTSCNTQQAMGLLSQQMNFYHGYPADMDYVSLESEDTYGFQSTSSSMTLFSSSPVRHQYQAPWHPLGTQSGYES
ncbi:PREDICTED: homeobox protein NANOG [Chaetura pelagica]|uniref:homeobox protein NANOG n=1 Tax=Chaetura pelagica TaxID=8897 RepID=UPI000523388D|nr:PREDICTED: homeobox protein NANOG [Chaetura pelagica]